MGGIFGGGSKTTKTVNDPWATMPDWMKEALEKDAEFRQEMLEQGKGIADELGEGGGEYLGISDEEREAYDRLIEGTGGADEFADMAKGRLGKDYESEYTDDVVETTLEGMQRKADRERLQRDARAAAVGGTSNTRAAVGQAVADQLTGMNMAEMEAKLRDDAHRWGGEMDLREAELIDSLASSEFGRALQGSAAQGMMGEKFREHDQEGLDRDRFAGRDSLSWLGSLFSGTNTGYGPTGGEQTSKAPGPDRFGQILGAGAAVLGGWLSDEEAKENIKPMEVGLDALRDVTPATYDYKEGMPTHKKGRQAGLIAQDLEHIPGAVEVRPDGLRQVDPYPVVAVLTQAVKELDDRTKPLKDDKSFLMLDTVVTAAREANNGKGSEAA